MFALYVGCIVIFVLFAIAIYWAATIPNKIEKDFLQELERAKQLQCDAVIFPKKPYNGPTLVKSNENE